MLLKNKQAIIYGAGGSIGGAVAKTFADEGATAMRSHFLTAKALVPIMSRQGGGVILSITATPAGIGYPQVGGFGPACCAIESFSRNLATEVGPAGIRVVNIRSAGSPDSRPFVEAMRHNPKVASVFISKIEGDTMLKRLPLMDDIARIAVFLASDHARAVTGVAVDATCGTTSGLNAYPINIPFA